MATASQPGSLPRTCILSTPLNGTNQPAPLFIDPASQRPDNDDHEREIRREILIWNEATEVALTIEREQMTRRIAAERFDNVDGLPPAGTVMPLNCMVSAAVVLPQLPSLQSSSKSGAQGGKVQSSTKERALQSVLCAAAFTAAQEIPGIFAARPEERTGRIALAAQRMAVAGGVAGLAAPIVATIQENLSRLLPDLIQSLLHCKTSTVVSLMSTAGIPVALTLSAVTSMTRCAKALFHAIGSVLAYCCSDPISSANQWDKMVDCFRFDDLCRDMSAAVTLGAFAMIGGPAGVVGFAVQACVFWTAQLIVNRVIAHKDVKGGYGNWLYSLVFGDKRSFTWEGEHLDTHQSYILPDLFCPMNKTLLYEPVRSRFNGMLYERAVLYAWLDKEHVDPVDRVEYIDADGQRQYKRRPATRVDYFPAPVAREKAHEMAKWLRAAPVRYTVPSW